MFTRMSIFILKNIFLNGKENYKYFMNQDASKIGIFSSDFSELLDESILDHLRFKIPVLYLTMVHIHREWRNSAFISGEFTVNLERHTLKEL